MSTWTAFGSTIAMTIKQPLLYENDNDSGNFDGNEQNLPTSNEVGSIYNQKLFFV